MKTYDLKPEKENVKSFYGKAWVEETPNRKTLYSYNRKVLTLGYYGYTLYGKTNNLEDSPFTATTMRHIKEFLYQNGYCGTMTKKDVFAEAIGVYECGKMNYNAWAAEAIKDGRMTA